MSQTAGHLLTASILRRTRRPRPLPPISVWLDTHPWRRVSSAVNQSDLFRSIYSRYFLRTTALQRFAINSVDALSADISRRG